jgi:hypothetical protein
MKKEGVEDLYEESLLSQVGPYDVLDRVGNCRFRITCQIYAPRYKDVIDNGTKSDRTALVKEVLSTIAEVGGRFLSSESGTWESVTLKKKKEKVGHAIRSAVTDIEVGEAECAIIDGGSEEDVK